MNSAICTLYENHYHHGVAALTNSLYNNGFRGAVYVGFRDALPPWADKAEDNPALQWKNGKTLNVADGLVLNFMPIITDYHLANYKPYFMIDLWSRSAINADAMFYFDPDIIIKCQWNYYENWISHGVALVHEINSNDMPASHPLRKNWEKVITKSKREIERPLTSYINSGFCGLKKSEISFLKDWVDITETAIDYFDFKANRFQHSYNRSFMFFAQDQDAFNIAAMSTKCEISEMGPEAMDFIHGGFTMSHAIGGPKPWEKKFIASAIKGYPPSLADKAFWKNAGSPIDTISDNKKKRKKIAIKVASFLGQFYRKY